MTESVLKIKAALIGLGSVHQNLLTILADKKDLLVADFNIEFLIVMIADSSGVAYNKGGFDMAEICAFKRSGNSVCELPNYIEAGSALDLIAPDVLDLVFEASPVDLNTGGTGLAVARKALACGVSVVLANKAPMVLAFNELTTLAKSGKAALKYSATVCGGLPVLNIGKRDLVAGKITKLQGIFNATSNFILDHMALGQPFEVSLKEAQDRGIAEADPSLDISGLDTANKLLIIANTIMGADITLKDISVEGIEAIDTDSVAKAKLNGNTIKLVAEASDNVFSVRPIAVPQSSFLGQCTGWEMAVELHTDIYGIAYYKLWEREPVPTAASMLRDALHIFAPDSME